MSIRNMISVGLLLFIIIALSHRFYIAIQLKKIEKIDNTPAMKQKIILFKEKESQDSLRVMLIILGCLVLTVMLEIYDQFRLDDQINQLVSQSKKMQEEIVYLNESQQRVDLKVYPDEGVGLVDLSWDKILTDENSKEEQIKIEMNLSETLLPYLAAKNIVLTIDVPSQTLSISVITRSIQPDQKTQVQENFAKFLAELNEVSIIRQVNLQMVKHNNTTENTYYSRGNETKKFEEMIPKD